MKGIRAVALLTRGCDLKDYYACDALGVVLRFGKGGIPKDLIKAKTLFENDCNHDFGWSCFNLGDLYREGDGVPKDMAKAVEANRKGCDLKEAMACSTLADIYGDGKGVPKESVLAAKYARLACDLKDGATCALLGTKYFEGEGVPKNRATAIELYSKSCDMGADIGCWALAKTLSDAKGSPTDVSRAVAAATKGCALPKHELSCKAFADLYYEGRGVKKDHSKAAEYYARSCNAEDAEEDGAESCLNAGNIYYTGSGGATSDLDKAQLFYDKACKLGNKTGCNNQVALGSERKWKESIDAVSLWQDYDANEIAADQKYRGKRLVVRGIVADLTKDFTDSVIVRLRSPNLFMSTHAYVDNESVATVATLKKGQKVLLSCVGSGKTMGSPILKDCHIDGAK
jgi:TPR repeat protein